ncbi:MAG: hypothetical protein AB7N91_29375 [Candidatus Tectimicrobiota bacterium]
MKEDYTNAGPKKPAAQFGDIKSHHSQGRAIRVEGERQSEHEHIRARINVVLQTKHPETSFSPYDAKAYGRSATLTIPRDMALIKTKLDLALRDKTKAALEKGHALPEALKQEMSTEADIARTIQAREQAIEARVQANLPVDELRAITDAKIIEAAHYQQGQVFAVGKRQPMPIQLTQADIRQLLQPFERAPGPTTPHTAEAAPAAAANLARLAMPRPEGRAAAPAPAGPSAAQPAVSGAPATEVKSGGATAIAGPTVQNRPGPVGVNSAATKLR